MKAFLVIIVIAAAAVTSSCRKESAVKPVAQTPKKDTAAVKAVAKITKPAAVPYDYQKAIMAKRTLSANK